MLLLRESIPASISSCQEVIFTNKANRLEGRVKNHMENEIILGYSFKNRLSGSDADVLELTNLWPLTIRIQENENCCN